MIEGLAVVGHEDGDLFAFAFETVEGETRRHAACSFGPGGLT